MPKVGGMRKANESGRVEHAKNKKKTLKLLWSYLSRYKLLLTLAIIFTILSSVAGLIAPFITGQMIDYIKKSIEENERNFYFFGVIHKFYILISLYTANFVFQFFAHIIMTKISKNIVFKMRQESFDSISRMPVSYFDHNQIGDILSKMSYDIDTVNTSLSNDFVTLATSSIVVFGSFGMMLYISWKLCLIFVFTIPLSFIISKWRLKKTQPLYRKRSRSLGILNGYSEEMITGVKTIKCYSMEEYTFEKYKVLNKDAQDAMYKADYTACATGPTVNFINQLTLALICIFGSILNIYEGFSYGKISSFVMYSRKFSGPINEMANIATDLGSALAAAERVFELINTPPEIINDNKDSITISSSKGKIDFENVKFGYTDQIVLHDFSLNVSPGEKIAIVGKTGAGKTTIINLLMRFYDINSGKILIDDIESKNITRESLRKQFSMVLQDTWLFEGTIFDNLRYGNPSATDEECIEACKNAHIHSYVMQLPNGYNTIIKENGGNTSKGQKQLLTIARAMLVPSSILILDEATSNVDTKTEMDIQDAMNKLMQNKTAFIIAHRLSTIKNADKILLLDHGDVIEIGNHKELMEKKGKYYNLFISKYNR